MSVQTPTPNVVTTSRYSARSSSINIPSLTKGMHALPGVLRQMGYADLRKGQDAAVATIMGQQDILVVMQTSGGKTACFVIPTLAMGWRTIVFSPLIALMQDQVTGLLRMGVQAGQISSGQNPAQNELTLKRWMEGALQILYVAPERLANEGFMLALKQCPPHMVTVDEAHCLSQWSDTFRSAYCKIGDYITAARPLVVSAFTATCPPEVEADIRRVLCLGEARKLLNYVRRDNLKLHSAPFGGMSHIADLLREANGPSIVYCATVKNLELTVQQLQGLMPEHTITMYHGQMDTSKKNVNMKLFMDGRAEVCVATNAFGMGVDKADIRMIVHRDIPGNPEALAQEVGRAGRDGKESHCHTLFDKESVRTQKWFLNNAHPSQSEVHQFYNALKSLADPRTNIVVASADQIANQSGVKTFAHRAVRQILMGAQVVTPVNDDRSFATVKFLGSSEDGKFRAYREAINMIGVTGKDGEIEVELSALSDQLMVEEPTIKANLKRMSESGLLSYTPPPRITPLLITGDPSSIDFVRLAERRQQAVDKLEMVVEYQNIPDSGKHDYIERCFKL